MMNAAMLLVRYRRHATSYERQWKHTPTHTVRAYRDVYSGAAQLFSYCLHHSLHTKRDAEQMGMLALRNADDFAAYCPFDRSLEYSLLPDGTFTGTWYEPEYAVAASKAFREIGESLQEVAE